MKRRIKKELIKTQMNSLFKYKKGQLAQLQAIVLALVFIGIILVAGFLIMEELREQVENQASEAEAGVNTTIAAIQKIPSWLGLIVIISIIGIVLAIVFSVLPRTTGARV